MDASVSDEDYARYGQYADAYANTLVQTAGLGQNIAAGEQGLAEFVAGCRKDVSA